jgi:hypothetical protein
MSDPTTTRLTTRATDYVDQVDRREQFLLDHPDAVITNDRDAPPHEHWRG